MSGGTIIAVLASDIEAGPPLTEIKEEPNTVEEYSIRFALTSEAGLNDGLAFPFTNLAIALAGVASITPVTWAIDWVLVDVAYKNHRGHRDGPPRIRQWTHHLPSASILPRG